MNNVLVDEPMWVMIASWSFLIFPIISLGIFIYLFIRLRKMIRQIVNLLTEINNTISVLTNLPQLVGNLQSIFENLRRISNNLKGLNG